MHSGCSLAHLISLLQLYKNIVLSMVLRFQICSQSLDSHKTHKYHLLSNIKLPWKNTCMLLCQQTFTEHTQGPGILHHHAWGN